MLAKRLVVFILFFMIFVCGAVAQDSNYLWLTNQLSVTGGRAFVSTQSIVNDPFSNDPDPRIHFGNDEMVAFNYGRLLTTRKIFGFYAELPVALYPHMNLNTYENQIPKDIGALFVTPSLRVNVFSMDSVEPWVSFGGGYGRFREADVRNFYGPNPGQTSTNTGVVQFGGGLDVWFWHRWGARFEVRDFYSGRPDYTVDTNVSRQHNYYVGVGVIHRF
ncbi:MAG: hypothetical protein WAK29_19685 [Terriglobales bacterium]